MYMKGLLATKGFLKSVLDKEFCLRTGWVLTHVDAYEVKGIDQLLFFYWSSFHYINPGYGSIYKILSKL